ncbi:hypothetical protein DRE_03191 [Drechslerella stenobrocha 248]|uniref:Uncharacterized protein n=1 Tax=Drechslerella stenobrocha 248 TaxID=1043628 RepID=W7HTU7_9PEZI|nr:hypothetical protein DRE_03191 [Drechslerella stenobrocha 248]
MLCSRRLSPLRLILCAVALVLGVSFLSSVSPVPAPGLENIQEKGKKTFGPYLPGWHSSSGAHKTPEPTNSTSSTNSWYEHWSWLNPFGTSKDYSDSRTVLPPLPPRCPIYAYYDQDIKASGRTRGDDAVMLAWRRAWWAAGFEPIILSASDAQEHGMYQKVKGSMQLPDSRDNLEYNILRWLAWDRMGAGLLSDFRVFPLPTADDPTIPFLRRCDFGETITRFESLGSALFAGSAPIIKAVVANITSWDAASIPGDVTSPADMAVHLFTTDPKPNTIAYYSRSVVADQYRDLDLTTHLPALINAHLHAHFQQQHPRGIHVLNPTSPVSDTLTLAALTLAHKLAVCVDSPLPDSCPPTVPAGKCSPTPCVKSVGAVNVRIARQFENSTDAFTVGAVPHPLTLLGMIDNRLVHQIDFIRRNSTRDAYIKTVTAGIAREGTGAIHRAVKLKEVIAAAGLTPLTDAGGSGGSRSRSGSSSDSATVDSIWATAENGWDIKDVEWILGFSLQDAGTATVTPPLKLQQSDAERVEQKKVMEDARHAIKATSVALRQLRGAVEGWSLGDFEVWKFVGAFEGRRRAEREKWTKREKGFGKGLEKN